LKRRACSNKKFPRRTVILAGAVLAIALAAAYAFVASRNGRPVCGGASASPHPAEKRSVASLGDLLEMTPDQLAKVDIAEMNLICAVGLPGAEGIDIDACLARLDMWAQRVKAETERHLYRLTDPQFADHAEHCKHSEARFRAEWLVSVLQKDIGLHYHPGFVAPDQPVVLPKTSKECFIHGLLDNDDAHKSFGGNCLSLPVAYTAVGRRLGYPIKLVCAKEHAFCRWEGADDAKPAWRDRFNFDGAGEGFSIDPDEFYLSWPRTTTADEIELCGWLQSLTPRQELAVFIAHRGIIQRHLCNDNLAALVSGSQSLRLWPTSYPFLQDILETSSRLWAGEVAAHPDIFRRSYGVKVVDGRVVPAQEPQQTQARRDPLAEMEARDETYRRNMQRAMPPDTVPTPVLPQPRSPYGPAVPRPYQPPIPGQLPR